MAIENPPFSSMGRLITRSYFHWLFPILIYSKFRLLLIFAIKFIKFRFFFFFSLLSPSWYIYICDILIINMWFHIFHGTILVPFSTRNLWVKVRAAAGAASTRSGVTSSAGACFLSRWDIWDWKWRGELAMNHGDLVTMVTVISGY
jgi:hypothetical protein